MNIDEMCHLDGSLDSQGILSLKQYLERIKMWYRLYDGPDENVGPL